LIRLQNPGRVALFSLLGASELASVEMKLWRRANTRMIAEQDHSPPFILSNRQQILHLIFGEWQPLLALLGKHFDGVIRIAWTKATPPRCIENCTQHFNREVRCTSIGSSSSRMLAD
jgi:hypothetical protein